jgi:hypothetical protein
MSCSNEQRYLLRPIQYRPELRTVPHITTLPMFITYFSTAQTGGIVAWTHREGNGGAPMPVRVRVVNRKRTDLSHEMRKAINQKLCSSSWLGCGGSIDSSVRLLLGHTRFVSLRPSTSVE